MKYGLRMIRFNETHPINQYWAKTERGIESWSSSSDPIIAYDDINEAHRKAIYYTSRQELYLVEELPNPPSIAAWKKSLGQ